MGIRNGNGNGVIDDVAGRAEAEGGATITYCVVPRDLAADLYDLLRKYWRDDPLVRVITERRSDDRRVQRRRAQASAPQGITERRKIRSAVGRRLSERRVLAVPVSAPPLPRRVRHYADRLVFFERIEASERTAEDIETNRLVLRFQDGDLRAFELLYMRYFDRVYAYSRMLLRSFHDAEDVAQQVFTNVMEALPRYEVRPDQPFRFWLFRITRNAALKALAKSGRLQLEETAELERRMERPAPRSPELLIDWLSDNDLAILVERLPPAQRQTLILRYALELNTDQIASVLDRSPRAIRLLQHRALRTLGDRLTAIREPRAARRTPMRVRVKPLPVLGWRRFALAGPLQPLARGESFNRYR